MALFAVGDFAEGTHGVELEEGVGEIAAAQVGYGFAVGFGFLAANAGDFGGAQPGKLLEGAEGIATGHGGMLSGVAGEEDAGVGSGGLEEGVQIAGADESGFVDPEDLAFGLLLEFGVGEVVGDGFGIGESGLAEGVAGGVGRGSEGKDGMALGFEGGDGFLHRGGFAGSGSATHGDDAVVGVEDVGDGGLLFVTQESASERVGTGGEGGVAAFSGADLDDEGNFFGEHFIVGEEEIAVDLFFPDFAGAVFGFDGFGGDLADAVAEGFGEEAVAADHGIAGEEFFEGVVEGLFGSEGGGSRLGAGTLELGDVFGGEAGFPGVGEFGFGEAAAFALAGEGAEFVFFGIGEVLFLGNAFDLGGAAGEFVDQGAGYPGDFPAGAGALDLVAEGFGAEGEAGVEAGLVEGKVAAGLLDLGGFPAGFGGIEGGVEDVGVYMGVGIGNASDGTGGEVDEFSPAEVAGVAVPVGSLDADTGLGLGFDVGHGILHAVAEGLEEAWVVAEGEGEAEGFGCMEVDVPAHGAGGVDAGIELVADEGVLVFEEAGELFFFDFSGEVEIGGGFAVPLAENFIGIVIGAGQAAAEISPGADAARAGHHANHYGIRVAWGRELGEWDVDR